MTETKRRIDDAQWMRGVRSDLDSDSDFWAVRTKPPGMSKLETIGEYLNTILTELGYPGAVHECPDCGMRHVGKRP